MEKHHHLTAMWSVIQMVLMVSLPYLTGVIVQRLVNSGGEGFYCNSLLRDEGYLFRNLGLSA